MKNQIQDQELEDEFKSKIIKTIKEEREIQILF